MPNSPVPDVRPPVGPAGLSTRFIAVAVMVVLVLVSGVAGAALDRLLVRPTSGQRSGPPQGGRGPGGPGGGGMIWNQQGGGRGGMSLRPFDNQLRGELALTPAQREAIDSALASQYRDFDTARRTIQPHLDSIIQATRVRIDAILTPAQRVVLPSYPQPSPSMRGGGMRGGGGNQGPPRRRDGDDDRRGRGNGGPSHRGS